MIHSYKCVISSYCEKKYCLTRSTLSSDTRCRPAPFPLQRRPVVWNCWYQRLMLLGDGGSLFELSPECPLNRNNWFVLHKLQHTKRLLLQSRHYRFVTSQTEREEGSEIAHAHETWTSAVSFHVGKLTSACVFIAVMADWNRSNHFDTPCRCNWYMNPQNYRYAWGKIQILFQDIQRSSLSTRLDIKAAGLQWFITVSGIEKKSLETIRQTSNDHEVTQWRHLLCSAKQTVQIHYLAHHNLTHCGRVKLICVFNTVKLGTSASSP